MRVTFIASLMLACAISAHAGLRESHNVTKLKDWNGTITYEVMSDTELKAYEKELVNESRLVTKALSIAHKEWKQNETYARKSFPRKVAAKRSISKVGSYDDAEKADDKVMVLQDRAREKEAVAKKSRGGNKKANASKAAKEAERALYYATARTVYEAALEKAADEKAARANKTAAK